MKMKDRRSDMTRRGFLKTAVGAAGATLVGGLYYTGRAAAFPGAAQVSGVSLSGTTLFSPGAIGPLQLKNRLIRTAIEEAYTVAGRPYSKYIKVLTDLAQGGVGMIITGISMVASDDALPFELYAFNDSHIRGFERVRAAVRDADSECRLVAQLGHTGHRYPPGFTRVGPSDVSWPADRKPMRALSIPQIKKIVNCFAQAARRFKEAGWDGVELHGAHGYLLSSFLSPYTNQRTDRYGGSLTGRVQIIKEIMEESRALVGDDFPIMIKVNSADSPEVGGQEVPGGIDKEIFIATAEELDKFGFDAIEISGNNPCQPGVNTLELQSYYLDAAKDLNVAMKVILTGGNRAIGLLEDILNDTVVDFIGLARPFIREPDLSNKWLSGESSLARCISCNLCVQYKNLIKGVRCHQVT